MAMMECAHCATAVESRAMVSCPDCGAMVCDNCASVRSCPDGVTIDTETN